MSQLFSSDFGFSTSSLLDASIVPTDSTLLSSSGNLISGTSPLQLSNSGISTALSSSASSAAARFRTQVTLGTTLDFNRDGKADFFRQERGLSDDDTTNTANFFFAMAWEGLDLAFGGGDWRTFVESSDIIDPLKGDFTNLYFGDFNGDGVTDILRQEKSLWDDDRINTANIYLSTSWRFGYPIFTKYDLPEDFDIKGDLTNLYLGDFNGDGKTDFLRQEKGSADNDNRNTANIFLSQGLSNNQFQFAKIDLPETFDLKGDLTNLYLGDFNGDGKTDFLRQEKGEWDNDDGNTAGIYLSNGNGSFRLGNLQDSIARDLKGDLSNLYLGDFNGDGRTDFLRQEKGMWDNDAFNTANLFISTGNGSFTKYNIDIPNENYGLKGDFTNLYLGDFDGDGKTDFLRQEKDWWDDDDDFTVEVFVNPVFLANGTVSFTRRLVPETLPSRMKGDYTNLYVGDFNGDGKADFLRQEKDFWDDDQFNTAIVFLSQGNGTFTRQNNLPESFALSGDLTRLYFGQPDWTVRDSSVVEILPGTLRADTFMLAPNAVRTVISGNGNVDFGTGGRDLLDLSGISFGSVSLNIKGQNGGRGVTYNPGNGNRIFDAIELSDGRQVLFEGIEHIRFADRTLDLAGFLSNNQFTLPNDPLFSQQWNLSMMGVHTAWRFGQGSDLIMIGVQDSGGGVGASNAVHPETRRTTFINEQNFRDEAAIDGRYSHGVGVQSIIAAASNNGTYMTGINWNSRIFSLDVIPYSDPGDLNIADATRFMVSQLRPDQRLVINMSLGAPVSSEFEDLVRQYQDRVLFVVATGNDNFSQVGYPASLAQQYGNVIAVGASWGTTDVNKRSRTPGDRISYLDGWGANYGAGLTLMAPSEVIAAGATTRNGSPFFTDLTNPMRDFNGTSAAAPNAAGVASLVWSANPTLTAVRLREILAATAVDLGAPGYDALTGHGLVNADAAVRRAISII
jgi:Subtilase family/FG-GAP-like repeat